MMKVDGFNATLNALSLQKNTINKTNMSFLLGLILGSSLTILLYSFKAAIELKEENDRLREDLEVSKRHN